MEKFYLQELDSVAPVNPVFLNGSFGGMINTKALELSGMMKLNHAGILRNERTGVPLGVIRGSAFNLLAINNSNDLTDTQQLQALKKLFYFGEKRPKKFMVLLIRNTEANYFFQKMN